MSNHVDWSKDTEAIVRATAEAQKKFWDGWRDTVDEWRKRAPHGPWVWALEAEPVIKTVAERLLGVQDMGLRLLDLWAANWKAVAPEVESGQDWEAFQKVQIEWLRRQVSESPLAMGRAVRDLQDLWLLYLDEWQKLAQPWVESWQRAPWHLGQAAMGDGSALVALMNLYWDACERTFCRWLESPSLGHAREMQDDVLKALDAWTDFRRASFEYQVLLAQGWARAGERWVRKLAEQVERGEPVTGLRRWLLSWVESLDEALGELFGSDEYARIQGQVVNTAMAYRLCEEHLVEAFSATSHVPTRKEMDEAYRRLYELRKEVKEVKKVLKDIKAELGLTKVKAQVETERA